MLLLRRPQFLCPLIEDEVSLHVRRRSQELVVSFVLGEELIGVKQHRMNWSSAPSSAPNN